MYLLQVTVVFSVLYIWYYIFFKHLTFYSLNRAILLIIMPLSFVLPMSQSIVPSITDTLIDVPVFEEISIYTFEQQIITDTIIITNPSINYTLILVCIYILGCLLSIIRRFISIHKLYILKRSSHLHPTNDYTLVISKTSEVFSFFRWIFIPETMVCDPLIIEHEKAHIYYKHSYDMIIYEFYIALFWFNPLMSSYRKSIKSVHEFQADTKVLQHGVTAIEYLQLLANTITPKFQNTIYNYFNNPILKQRIDMITKPSSNNFTKFTYLLLLPICALLLSAFTKPITPILEEIPLSEPFDFVVFDITPPSLFPVQNASKDHITSFFGERRSSAKFKYKAVHGGIDIKAAIGTPVIATADGVIAKATDEGDWGNLIVITHSEGYETWYAHLNGFAVHKNQKVKKGDVIGYVGNTGQSKGPHLHYEVKQHNKRQDPLNYIK